MVGRERGWPGARARRDAGLREQGKGAVRDAQAVQPSRAAAEQWDARRAGRPNSDVQAGGADFPGQVQRAAADRRVPERSSFAEAASRVGVAREARGGWVQPACWEQQKREEPQGAGHLASQLRAAQARQEPQQQAVREPAAAEEAAAEPTASMQAESAKAVGGRK